MKWICAALCLIPVVATAQSSIVRPDELDLSVTVEATGHTPYVREMVLITIQGVYRRHITRESLGNPDFDGFSWSQLGPDSWREERRDGRLVKVFERRMAVYPDRPGRLTIDPFVHNLTLTDEGDDWFEHRIQSEPITIDVVPAPSDAGWWFPVRRLEISDQWSNAPDQLAPGEGVLRVIRLEALGVTPEMIPPMPELTSPSAMIFPHPEKRLAELTPEGPVTYAFWRWTIQPTNDVSAIVEPLEFDFFDTTLREAQTAQITAQRVAYGQTVPEWTDPMPAGDITREYGTLPGWSAAVAALVAFALAVRIGLAGRTVDRFERRSRGSVLDPLRRQLRHAARSRDVARLRAAAVSMISRDGGTENQTAMLRALDRGIFAAGGKAPDLSRFAREFCKLRT